MDSAFGAWSGVTSTTAAFFSGLGIGGVTDATPGAFPSAPARRSTSPTTVAAPAPVTVGTEIATISGPFAPSPKPSVTRS